MHTTDNDNQICGQCRDSLSTGLLDLGEAECCAEIVGTAANRAADLIQERLDSDGDELAWNVANIMVSATLELLANPEASLAAIFVKHFGADDADPTTVMAEYGMD
ncbi:hypothetical protein DQ226_18555 [Dietzia maris]|jgi:hypothetical protein|uniref:Uncharacterized protein n=1 Tax=Dietzia maris TaxID=37915 RepID=A0A365P3I0_9ACTN|nr:hypothetical protein DQ226_18555 [Dietzia maris]